MDGDPSQRRPSSFGSSHAKLRRANITTTLNTYTHLFDHARNAEGVKQRLEEEFGEILATST